MPRAKRRRVEVGDLDSRVEEGLIKVVGPEGRFKSEEQREGLRGVMRGDDPLVVVLPTGGGKSLLFMAPALLKGSRTTIVVVPFAALAEDMMKRCKEAGLSCIKWKMGPKYGAQVVIVAAAATTKEFRQHAWSLQVDGRLDRIVMDECHIVLESRHFRDLLQRLKKLAIPCQFIYLTATLPLTMWGEFERAMLLEDVKSMHGSTVREKFSYRVEVCDEEEKDEWICRMADGASEDMGVEGRVVVFCKSRSRCESLGMRLGCGCYHAGVDGKAERLESWVSGENRVMVATGALGTGVDVTEVIHVGIQYGMITFCQESGRAGRRGERVKSTIVLSSVSMNG
jgi:superfamily II DNA helicase RecQ